MIRNRRIAMRLGLALAASFVMAGAVAATAAPVPDAARLVALRLAFENTSRVRVRTAAECVLLNEPSVSEAGVSGMYGVTRPTSITATRETQRLVRWSEIDSVQAVSSGAGRGALYGAGVGLVLGIAMAASVEPERIPYDGTATPGGRTDGLRLLALTTTPLLGLMTGSLVGRVFPRWKTIAP